MLPLVHILFFIKKNPAQLQWWWWFAVSIRPSKHRWNIKSNLTYTTGRVLLVTFWTDLVCRKRGRSRLQRGNFFAKRIELNLNCWFRSTIITATLRVGERKRENGGKLHAWWAIFVNVSRWLRSISILYRDTWRRNGLFRAADRSRPSQRAM